MAVREASHAGSWYNDLPDALSDQLDRWLNHAVVSHAPARAIIAPHAGYQYSGACAAHAYKQVNPALIKRVFILGPAHNNSFSSCALTKMVKYETPFYDLQVDVQVNRDLEATGAFEVLDKEVEDEEHSIELQLPYVVKIMQSCDEFTIVPILVGSLHTIEHEETFGKIFSVYLKDPSNLFVISSDFCHWGQRYSYLYYDKVTAKPIYQFIEDLDRLGMAEIEKLSTTGFHEYIDKHGNTICGRVPIFILLHAVNELIRNQSIQSASLKFIKYTQSKRCNTMKDYSVSYAAASLVIE